jgi:hypothetical protein
MVDGCSVNGLDETDEWKNDARGVRLEESVILLLVFWVGGPLVRDVLN